LLPKRKKKERGDDPFSFPDETCCHAGKVGHDVRARPARQARVDAPSLAYIIDNIFLLCVYQGVSPSTKGRDPEELGGMGDDARRRRAAGEN